jgi:hypothetical protein
MYLEGLGSIVLGEHSRGNITKKFRESVDHLYKKLKYPKNPGPASTATSVIACNPGKQPDNQHGETDTIHRIYNYYFI